MRISAITLLLLLLTGCSPKVYQSQSGLQYRILEKGVGIKVQEGDEVFIYETTTYRNGTVLYSNYGTETPVKVLVGGNQATKAVDEGLRGMQTVEIRELIAPPYLVKRKSYPNNVSPDSTLVIKIKLDKIVRKK